MAAARPPARSPVLPPQLLPANAATVLAFDFGLARIGVAVGDQRQRSAHPLPGIRTAAYAARFAAVERLLAEWRPARLVVGMPLAADGSAHAMTRRAERFARRLEGRFRLPVARVDERYTSAEAESRVREAAGARRAARAARDKLLDSYAAQLILEQYFSESGR